MRFIFGPLLIALGILMMRNTVTITNWTGQIEWAERYLKGGVMAGTYTLWRLLGLVICILAAFWMFGMLDLVGRLFGAVLPGGQH